MTEDDGQSDLVLANDEPAKEAPAKSPRWERPSNSKQKAKVAQILIHKANGKKGPEIAELMGTTEGYVRHLLWLAGKNGWFTEEDLVDPAERLVYDTSHKIVRNINKALDGEELKPGQQEMTIEAAKGIGLWKNHSAVKQEGVMQIPVLAIKVELPPTGDAPPAPSREFAGGTPAYGAITEGEIVDAERTPE